LKNLDSTSLKLSPFFFSYGQHPKLNILTKSTGRQGVDEFLVDLQKDQQVAIECLVQARKLQAKYYNKGRRDTPVYKEGHEVLLLQKQRNWRT
jgi:hypothetical protein